MKSKILILLLFFCVRLTNAQELNCTVTVNSQLITATNQQVFKTLQTSLTDFVNKTIWTTTPYKSIEKINCGMTIIVDEYSNDEFSGSIQIQSSRTAFNSTYQSPILNINDKNFNFKYQEFEQLIFNPNNFDSNLVSVIAFYSYMVIGLDQDSYTPNGGDASFETAINISNLAQSSGYKGWSSTEKGQNRFLMINDLTSNTFSTFREVMLNYHLNGMDLMSKDTKQAKNKIVIAINNLKNIHIIRPNSFLMRMFFDAKTDEITSVFTGGPRIPVDDLVSTLNSISPLNSGKWGGIN